MKLKHLILSASIALSSILTTFGHAANAQSPYEEFEPPLGFYVDYSCFDPNLSYSRFEATIYSSQGGLMLISDSDPLMNGSADDSQIPAIFDQAGYPYAWQYKFMAHHESGDTMEMIFTDVWDGNDFDELKFTRYPAEFNGAPRAPQVSEYMCQSISGGVNPFREF